MISRLETGMIVDEMSVEMRIIEIDFEVVEFIIYIGLDLSETLFNTTTIVNG